MARMFSVMPLYAIDGNGNVAIYCTEAINWTIQWSFIRNAAGEAAGLGNDTDIKDFAI